MIIWLLFYAGKHLDKLLKSIVLIAEHGISVRIRFKSMKLAQLEVVFYVGKRILFLSTLTARLQTK